jgi:hypothetical protein
MLLCKIDTDGELVGQKSYGGPGMDSARQLLSEEDGYVLMGETESYGPERSNLLVLKMDLNLDIPGCSLLGLPAVTDASAEISEIVSNITVGNETVTVADAVAQANHAAVQIETVYEVRDSDNDMIMDDQDNCPCLANFDQLDSDVDGIGDDCDNCLAVCNVSQFDADGDSLGDVCDVDPGCGGCGQSVCELDCSFDFDTDGILDDTDNCPLNCNANQLDADEDGIGDVCDATPGCGGCGVTACETEC